MQPQDTAQSPSVPNTPEPRESRRVLLAYFSRAGENYYYGGRTTRTNAAAGAMYDVGTGPATGALDIYDHYFHEAIHPRW